MTNAAVRSSSAPVAVVGAFVSIAASIVAMASFEFMLVPMQTELAMSVDAAHSAILISSAGTLAVVFLAGSLGDRIGHRRLLVIAALVFIAGAVLVALSTGSAGVIAGRILSGVGGIIMSILGLAVLNSAFTDDHSRARVFGAFAALTPAVFIVTPALAAWLTTAFGWRSVPLLWVAFGLLALVFTLRAAPDRSEQKHGGDVLTPLLAGLSLATLCLGATFVVETPRDAAVALALTAALLVALIVAYRRTREPGLDLRVLRVSGSWLLVAAILIASAPNMFIYTNLLLQYRYSMSLVSIALLLSVSQMCAVGGGFLGGWLSGRIGAPRAAALVLAVGGFVALGALAYSAASAVWVPILVLSLIAVPAAAMAGALAKSLMDLAPEDGSAGASAWNNVLWSVGPTLGGVLVSSIAFASFERALASGLGGTALSAAQADAVAHQVREGAVVAELAKTPLLQDSGAAALLTGDAPALLGAQASAFSVAGVLTCVCYLAAAVLMALYSRRRAHALA